MIDWNIKGVPLPDLPESYPHTVYDDSRSWYQYLKSVALYLNDIGKLTDDMRKYLEEFLETFDVRLYNTVEEILEKWLNDGVLTDLIRDTINEEVIEARRNAKNVVFNNLKERLDDNDLRLELSRDYINVVEKGVKNDGSLIPNNLINNIIKNNIGKTIFFPAGLYNLSEPIKTFNNPEKRVNLHFDRMAVIKSDINLESLLFIGGFDEILEPDRTEMTVYGGSFDATNCNYGILINRRKANVTLKDNYIQKAVVANIIIKVVNNVESSFTSTDINIEGLFIEGRGTQFENYGIYIPNKSHDTKMRNMRIQGCSTSIFIDSGGNYISNAHLFSRGDNLTFKNAIGIHFGKHSSGGTLSSVYFDTVGTAIKVEQEINFNLKCVNAEYFSYLTDFLMCFLDIPHFTNADETRISIISSNFMLRTPGSFVIKTPTTANGYDYKDKIKVIGCQFVNKTTLSPSDLIYKMSVVDRYYSLVSNDSDKTFSKGVYYTLGLMLRSSVIQNYRVYIKGSVVVEFGVRIVGSESAYGIILVYVNAINNPSDKNFSFSLTAIKASLGYVLAIKFHDEDQKNAVISVSNISQDGNFMVIPTPIRTTPVDYFDGVQVAAIYEIFRG